MLYIIKAKMFRIAEGLRADGSADVSSSREVTGQRSKYAPGATCQRGHVAGVVGAGGSVLHCIEPTEEVTVVVEESTGVVSP